MNLAHIIDGHPADHVALVSRGVETTYGQLRDQVARVRGGLVGLGVGQGDRVALLCGNGRYFVETYLAALGLGAVVVPLNPQSPAPEIEREIATVDAAIVMVEPAAAAAWAGVDAKVTESVRHVIATEPTEAGVAGPPEARARVRELDASRSIEDPDELRRTVPVLVGTIVVFFFHQALHIEPATVAMGGATVMLFTSRQSLGRALEGIEWPTLFFFLGLFVMVGALEETGAIDEVAEGIADLTGGDRSAELFGIAWASALGSALVDNIPFTAAMVPVVESLGGDDAYWWALALGACFGGNATLVAAAANVAASGMAARAGQPIGFLAFMRVGVPVTLVSMLLATGYIALRYL
ncbi:MAG: SLC13 family permease [Solirubrobacteraceae bacterium]